MVYDRGKRQRCVDGRIKVSAPPKSVAFCFAARNTTVGRVSACRWEMTASAILVQWLGVFCDARRRAV